MGIGPSIPGGGPLPGGGPEAGGIGIPAPDILMGGPIGGPQGPGVEEPELPAGLPT